ncbi:MAG TPA: homoserine dehydrogenase [Roseiflexaceae bacterium]|nr:homoserine dehydrogenase [Roseiflexaceae bacterium]
MTPQRTYRIILIGFGAVGQGFAQILRDQGARIATQTGADLRLVGVATRSRGSVGDPAGINPATLLDALRHDGDLRRLPGSTSHTPHELIATLDADLLIEATATDLQSGEPATSHIRAALARNMHVVTVNKGPAALHLAALRREAAVAGCFFGFEGTVMAGTPALRLALEDLAGCEIREVRGIVNGTTNYILTQMEGGMEYGAALAEAQRLGYAEADPTGDVEGFDAAGKAAIMAAAIMDTPLHPDQVERTGISGITGMAVAEAAAAGERWKLIARVWRDASGVHASVQPTRLPATHPLAGVGGATNALTITTDLLGEVTLIGPGAGGIATGFAILSDILALHRQQ